MLPQLPQENTQAHGNKRGNVKEKEKEKGSVKETIVEETDSIRLVNIDVTKPLDQQPTLETQVYQAALAITIQCFHI